MKMRWQAPLLLFVFAAILLVADAGQAVANGSTKSQGPMFTSEEIARSRIRAKAQEEILSRSRLDRGKSPGSPQSPLSGGSGVQSPGGSGSRMSPELRRPQNTRPGTYLQDPPPPKAGVSKPNSFLSSNERKPSCASLCQTVYQQPPQATCIFDFVVNDYVPLRNTAHIACYKCLNPNSRIEVRNQINCDGQPTRPKRSPGL